MKDKPLVYWVSTPTEVEYDMSILSKVTNKMDLRICTVGTVSSIHSYGIDIDFIPYDSSKVPYEVDIDGSGQRKLFERIVKDSPDLVIKKAGWTGSLTGNMDLFPKIMKNAGIKHCLWTSEQGCLRNWQAGIAKYYDWVVLNNREDLVWYKHEFGDSKKFSYMPFGCVPEFHKKVETERKSLICSYSNPQVSIPIKANSLERIVGALTPYYEPQDLALYGKDKWYPKEYRKFWRGEFYYSKFPEINSSSDIMLGISANTETGGYGTKLAKMLSCGAFVLWDYTKGIENDFENGKHLVWSKSKEETISLVKYYLDHPDERRKIADAGQKYAHEHLLWEKNLLGLVSEIE
jgi:hypothetical protein